MRAKLSSQAPTNGALLPTELLSYIFCLVQILWPLVPRGWTNGVCLGWFELRSVCRRWWLIINRCKMLWAHPPRLDCRVVDLFLKRSQGQLLTIEVDASRPLAAGATRYILREVQTRVVRLILHNATQTTLNDVLELRFPALKRIIFEADPGDEDQPVSANWDENTFAIDSNVLALDLSLTSIPQNVIQRFKNLSELYLQSSHRMHNHPDADLSSLVGTLPALPNLETLGIKGLKILGYEKDRTAVLSSLRRLEVSASEAHILDFLSTFRMPVLADLDLDVQEPKQKGLSQAERFCEAIKPFVTHFDCRATRLDVTVYPESPSTIELLAESGLLYRLDVVIPAPKHSLIKHLAMFMRRLELVGCDHLVLRSWPCDLGRLGQDNGWPEVFQRSSDLGTLTISGYGDRWKYLCNLMKDKGKSLWPSLKEVKMSSGFWVEAESAIAWEHALKQRQECKAQVNVLSFSQWEMQQCKIYKEKFRAVVGTLHWEVREPGTTKDPTCPHGRTFFGELCI